MPTTPPLGISQLMDCSQMVVSKECSCCTITYGVEVPGEGIIITVNGNWGDYFLKDTEDKVIAYIRRRTFWFKTPIYGIQVSSAPVLRIHLRSLLSKFIHICDDKDRSVLRLKRTGVFSYSYDILGDNGFKIGRLKRRQWWCDWKVFFPQDLDVRYKIALIGSCVYIILGDNGFKIGRLKRRQWWCDWKVFFPQDLDVRYKIALIGSCVYIDYLRKTQRDHG